MRRYTSRKFALTIAAMIIITVALFTHYLGDAAFVSALLGTLGFFKAADIVDKKLNGPDQ